VSAAPAAAAGGAFFRYAPRQWHDVAPAFAASRRSNWPAIAAPVWGEEGGAGAARCAKLVGEGTCPLLGVLATGAAVAAWEEAVAAAWAKVAGDTEREAEQPARSWGGASGGHIL
jgi:hypothetical protein